MEIYIDIKKQEVILKSILWNTIIEYFLSEKNINFEEYLKSIQLKWAIFYIKTNKPLINAEILWHIDKIKNIFEKKVKLMWFKNTDFKFIIL